jgi:hypothetical protein
LTGNKLMQFRSNSRSHQPHSFGNDRWATGERFETTSISTPTTRTIGHQSLMTEFPGSSEWPESQLSIDRDSAADPCTN